MHLTNYSINKNASNFEANEDMGADDSGHKRSVSSVFKLIEERESDPSITAEKLWSQIDDIAVKTSSGSITYGVLAKMALGYADAIEAAGLSEGSRVAVLAQRHPSLVAAIHP